MVAPRELSPDILHTRTADMRPAVLRYAENIQAQRVQIVTDLGFTSLQELQTAIAANPRAFISQRKVINRFTELTGIIKDILENPKEYKLFFGRETELRKLFGEDFVVSFDAIERAFTLKDGTHVLEISPEERQWAMEGLIDKLDEPDVIKFLKKLEFDKTEADKWMLVYRTSAKINDTVPVSILGLRDVLDSDARKGTGGEKLVYRESATNKGWYRDDKRQGDRDVWAYRPVQPGWMFVTKTVVDGTMDKKHADQTLVLKKKARELGFADGKFRRRTPQEVLYDTLVIFKANGIRLLENEYDWTEQETSDGDVVRVGYFNTDGVDVRFLHPGDILDSNGSCISR